MNETLRIPATDIEPVLREILEDRGFNQDRAQQCARFFIETTLDGVYSHGLNRFPSFLGAIGSGHVNPAACPTRIRTGGAFESWDGNLGPGNLNAWDCMGRAIELAAEHGIAAVALRNTNHWMRGGTYGLQAARAGCIGICMTNTKPNMPAWGAREASVGNNPFVVAVPKKPYPFLLDMAMSQFSYGKMEMLERSGERLPFPGGFDQQLRITDDPGAILESERALPMGYWKGSGLAMMIDLLVSILSSGRTTQDIGEQEPEHGVSQLFIVFDLQHTGEGDHSLRVAQHLMEILQESVALQPGGRVCYPGQQTWSRRVENERLGLPVNRDLWERIKSERETGSE